jgi:hypothetical protein
MAPMQTARAAIPLAYQTVSRATKPSSTLVPPLSAVIGSAAARQRATTGGAANQTLARSSRDAERGLMYSSWIPRPSLGIDGPPMTWERKKALKAGTDSATRIPGPVDREKTSG